MLREVRAGHNNLLAVFKHNSKVSSQFLWPAKIYGFYKNVTKISLLELNVFMLPEFVVMTAM